MARASGLTRLAYAALALAYVQAVLGAIVRITGSGMGCGDHWPRCHGQWFPPLDRMDLVIEVMHRYVAATLTLAVLALLLAAWRRRSTVAGSAGVFGPAAVATVLVVAAALLGAITVKLELHAGAVVIHLALAMSLIAALALAVLRARAGDGAVVAASSPRTARAAGIAATMALLAVILGGVTANIAGAAVSCVGFPHCREIGVGGMPLIVQVTHRVLAFALLFHLLGMVLALRKRTEPPAVGTWAKIAFATVLAQILVAAAMVELGLPLHLRILHQAVGTLVWLTALFFAATTRQRARS